MGETGNMRTRGLIPTIVATLAILFAPTAALAVPQLSSGETVYDEIEFLDSSAKSNIEDTIDQASDDGLTLRVAIVKDFEGKSPDSWCQELGNQSSLPGDAVVYAISPEIREYNVCRGPNAPVDNSDVNYAGQNAAGELYHNPLLPEDVERATSVLSETLIDAMSGSSDGGGSSSGNQSSGDKAIEGIAWVIVIVILASPIILVVALVMYFSRRGKKQKKQAIKSAEQRAADASVLLMQTDDAVRSAADDLAFARAQFGELETEKFQTAVANAEQKMTQAFQLQASLEDAKSEGQKHNILEKIEKLTQEVNQELDAHVKQFAQLRNVEANLDSNISGMRARVKEARDRNRLAVREIETLRITRTESALTSILDNPDNATQLLDGADHALDEAEQLKDKQRKEAVYNVNVSQRLLSQALAQIDEVMNAGHDLDNARERLLEAIASISSDLDDVERLATDRSQFGVLVDDAKEAIENGHRARKGEADPLTALSQLREAEDALDRSLAPLRNRESQDMRNRQRLDARFNEVDQAIVRADSYISTHRHYAGAQARQWVAEAKAKRNKAAEIAPNDAAEALTLLADALVLANKVVDESRRHYDGGISQGGRTEIDLGSMILGGLLFGGGSSSSSSGGWSSSSGGFWGGSGGSFGGGFGGGGGGFGGGFSSGGSGKF